MDTTRAWEALEELQKIGQQRYQIHQKIVETISKAIKLNRVKSFSEAPVPSPVIAPASKLQTPQVQKRVGGQLGTPPPDLKKPRLDEAEKRISELWRKCGNIVSRISSKQRATWFLRPVSEKDVPGYHAVIKLPMDLGTVKSRLTERYYKDIRDFATDVRQIWKNCRTYNQPGQPAYNAGEQCSEEFEKSYAEGCLEQQWDEIQMMKDPQNVSLERRLSVSSKQLVARVNSVAQRPEFDPSRDMTLVEKRKLSVALGELQGHQVAPVLEIIAEHQSDLDLALDTEEQAELDIDALNSATLWKLREYVDGVFARQAAGGGAAAAGSTAAAGQAGLPAGGGGGSVAGKTVPGGGTANGLGGESGSRPSLSGLSGMGPSMSGADSENNSMEDIKGSNLLGTQQQQQQQKSVFVKSQRGPGFSAEGESATPAPKAPSYASDKKTKEAPLHINSDKWASETGGADEGSGDLDVGGNEEGSGEGEGDEDLWDSFKSIAEVDLAQKADAEKRKRDLEQEQQRKREAETQEAQRQRAELLQLESQQEVQERERREEARRKELEEIKKHASNAGVYPSADLSQFGAAAASADVDMTDIGLTFRRDDDDEGFED